MDPHRGQLQNRKVILHDYRVNPAICKPIGGAEPRPGEESCTASLADPPRSG
jgi:hypothetical protein